MTRTVTVEDIVAIVRLARTKVDAEVLKPDSDLVELGADSLDMMTILLEVQDRTGIEIPDADVASLRTPAQIARFVADRAA